jgi:LysM repeat protein
MRRTLLLSLMLLVLLGLVACQTGGDPVRLTPSDEAAADLSTADLAVTPAVMPTLTIVATVEAVARNALRIRSGPGLHYPIIGDLAASGRVAIIGVSPDRTWFKIECFEGISAPECWIIGDADYWEIGEAQVGVPIAAAPPVPTPTPTSPTPTPSPTSPPPTPTPCVVVQPAGWISYRIVVGDSLSTLSARFGTSIESLKAVNCLQTNEIRAGNSILVPGGSSSPVVINPVPSTVTPTPTIQQSPALTIAFTIPNRDTAGCLVRPDLPTPDAGQQLAVEVQNTFARSQETFEVTDMICIYVLHLDPDQPVDVKIMWAKDEGVSTSEPSPGGNAWSYVLDPRSAIKTDGRDYWVEVTQGNRSRKSEVFSVTLPNSLKVRFHPSQVSPGEKAVALLAGLKPEDNLYLYRSNRSVQPAQWERQSDDPLQPILINGSKEAILSIQTSLEDAGYCFLVHTGERVRINPADPRVFSVGVSPKNCK